MGGASATGLEATFQYSASRCSKSLGRSVGAVHGTCVRLWDEGCLWGCTAILATKATWPGALCLHLPALLCIQRRWPNDGTLQPWLRASLLARSGVPARAWILECICGRGRAGAVGCQYW